MAIGPVERYTIEELEEDEAYRTRPQWMKFYYAAWLLSTAQMDEEQRGWYIQLLTWSASEGDFPGYIIDEEDEIKSVAGFRDLPIDLYYALSRGAQIPVEVLNDIRTNRLAKWKKVRNKFSPSTVHPGYLSNRRLVKALKDAYKQNKVARKAGKVSAEKRWHGESPKPSRRNEIITPVKQENIKKPTALSLDDEEVLQDSLSVAEASPDAGLVNVMNNRDLNDRLTPAIATTENGLKIGPENEENKPAEIAVNKGDPNACLTIKIPGSRALSILSLDQDPIPSLVSPLAESSREEIVLVSQPLRLVKSLDQDSNLSGSTNEKDGNTPGNNLSSNSGAKGRRRRSPEILFREDDFVITLEMSLYIKHRWSYLDTGDCQYMAEKFKLVFHKLSKSSLKRTFYNFIDNQLVKYNYRPGDYKKLQALLEQQKGNQDAGTGKPTQAWAGQNTKPWESSAERGARLEREADDRIRQLQGAGNDRGAQDKTGMPLPLD